MATKKGITVEQAALYKKWERERKMARDNLWIGARLSCTAGLMAVEASVESLPGPIAFVYFRFDGNNTYATVMQSFVHDAMRRNGIRTQINNWLFKTYPQLTHIVTERGSPEGGEAFMKASGYKYDGHYWRLKRPRKLK